MVPERKQLPHDIPRWLDDPSTETYFLTICAEKRGDDLVRGELPGQLLESIRFYNGAKKWRVNLAVIMPDHVHFLAAFDGKLAPAVRAWKHWTARHLGVEWQRDFFEHRVRREESLTAKVSYILDNPVRAGLVEHWDRWPHLWIAERPV